MKPLNFTSGVIALVAAGLFLFVLWCDMVLLGFPVFPEETSPDSSGPFLFRAVLLAAAAGLLFFSILRQRCNEWASGEPAWFEDRLRWSGVGIALTAVAIFLMDEQLFHDLSKEDHMVEHASTVLLFSASVCLFWLLGRLVRTRPFPPLLCVLASLSFAFLFFLIGMEEISWFQRTFALETPETILKLSERDELNVHNMYTAMSEVLYTFGAFVFLVLIPFVHNRTALFERLQQLHTWIPTRTVTLIAAPAFVFNYDLWNAAFVQFTFWFTLLVVVHYAWETWSDPSAPQQERLYTLSVLVLYLVVQFAFFADGERQVRLWDVSEYKELILPFSFLVYTFLTVGKIRAAMNITSPPSPLTSPVAIILSLFLLVSLQYLFIENVTESELDILMLAKQAANPDFLPGEFYLNQTDTPRTVFLTLLSPLIQSFSFMTVSIIGRLMQFLLVCIGVGLIARRIGLNALSTVVAIGVYCWYDQTLLPGDDPVFEGLEAMNLGYSFLLFGLYALLNRHVRLAALWAGCATSVHLLIGVWGSLALGLTVLSERIGTWNERWQAAGLWCVGAIVGLMYLLSFLGESLSDLPFDTAWLYVYFRVPHDLDPKYWEIELYEFILAALLCWVLARVKIYFPNQPEQTIVGRFTLWTLVPFAVGLMLAKMSLSFSLTFLQTYPFRVGGTLLLLLGLLIAMQTLLQHAIHKQAQPWLVATLAASFFWFAGGEFVDGFQEFRVFPRGAQWRDAKTTHALYDVCDWIREHTEPGAMLITSPDEQPVAYLCQRPVVVRFKSIPFSKAGIAEWHSRLIAFNGGEEPKRRGYRADREMAKNFQKLSAETYQELARMYGGRYLLIRRRTGLDLPELYHNKEYAVFRLDLHPPQQSQAAETVMSDTRHHAVSATRQSNLPQSVAE